MRVWSAERARSCADSIYIHLEKDLIESAIDRIKRAARRGAYEVEISNPDVTCYTDSAFERYINSKNVDGFVRYFANLRYRVDFVELRPTYYYKIEITWGEESEV